jgi:acyl-homoserine-lactone acylase
MLTWWLVVLGCRSEEPPGTPPEPQNPHDLPIGPYTVDIRTTEYGVPHILAEDYGSIGFGMGYAHARDHLCTLADQIVKVRSERSKYFGPGEGDAHLDSDFGWLGLQVYEQAEQHFLELPDEEQALLVGYAAGYDRYLEDTPASELDPRCGGADWVFPIDQVDLFAYYLHLGQISSGYNLVREVGNATPPGLRALRAPPPPLSALEPFRAPPIGSNGWAVGRDRTANGQGMILSNTHFPAEGELQWWESHVTIPGTLNVYGASLVGVAVANLGFNEDVAWTHTVSVTPRFVVYQLTLDPADPTRYEYDGDYVAMTSREHTIEVKQDDGSLVSMSRELWRTQWGPVFNAPVFGWNTQNAYTWRDVNAANLGMLSTWAAMGRARSRDEFEAAQRDHQGIPWVHTLLATQDGEVLYLDSSATPNLSPAAEAAYQAYVTTDGVASLFSQFGLTVVDGSDPVYDWVEDDRAVLPGAIPYDDNPRLLRTDFVNNANNNHWLANPLEPLTGFPMLYGPTGAPAGPRTKVSNRSLLEHDGASGPDDKFDLDELEAAALSGRGSLAEDLLAQVVERCQGVTEVDVAIDGLARTVDVSEGCAVLGAWDGKVRMESVGAALWRELVSTELNALTDLVDQGRLFGDTFDPANPIYTPTTLSVPVDPEADPVLEDLAAAVYRLEQAGIALDAPLGDIQFRVRGEERIPTMGGSFFEGVLAVGSYAPESSTLLPIYEPLPAVSPNTGLSSEGYYVNDGNSFLLAMRFGDAGPEARAILTYSQSEDPSSPHFSDQSRLYVEQRLRPVRFSEQDIAADPELDVISLTYP